MAKKRSFEVNWGMLVFAITVIVAAWFVPRLLDSSRSAEETNAHASIPAAVPAPDVTYADADDAMLACAPSAIEQVAGPASDPPRYKCSTGETPE